ncbi:MAG TPA: glycosyltransferase family 9 protein [Elusimicrobiota bacterium]|nr:glycosyltransferase family 9 protein [Elusimicrobiota bacterium]
MIVPRSSTDLYRSDCRYFRPESPCAPHKKSGVLCRSCRDYQPAHPRLLVLKTAAVGDVLRTTALLPAFKKKFPSAHITWVAQQEALPLFEENPCVDRVLPFSFDTFLRLRQDQFDLLWSLDFAVEPAAWAAELKADRRVGFIYHRGVLGAFPPGPKGSRFSKDPALEWVNMSLNDRRKRENGRTYQEWMFDICGLRWDPAYRPQWFLREEEKRWAAEKARGWRWSARDKILGINTGAGARWEQKRWPMDRLRRFIRSFSGDRSVRLMLLGGPEERERNQALKKEFSFLTDSGCDHSLRRFAALVDLCSVVLTGDTMALHLAVALRKKVVALFGPTSSAEIELYGRGIKVHKDWDCLPCYRRRCLKTPHCMESLSETDVLKAVRRFL